MSNNLMTIPTVSNLLSLINSILVVFFVYKYKSTNDKKWFHITAIVMFIYLCIDICLDVHTGISERISYIIHHIISIFLILWGRINEYCLGV